jgi:hypothetical protein
MQQSGAVEERLAHEVLWTYTAAFEESGEKDFYIALEKSVLTALRRACAENGRVWVGRTISLKVGSYILTARLINVEPVLATTVNIQHTTFHVRYQSRARDEGQDLSRFISEVIRYPHERMETVYESLIGLDTIKQDLVRKLNLLLQPGHLTKWLDKSYPLQRPVMLEHILNDRYPLFVLEGEVGSGKTALARSVGSRVARRINSEIMLLVVSAQIRGGGHVGELTQNLAHAFDEAEQYQEREQIPVLLLIDEADSLAQTRGSTQTHHEDDAGVNTLIQRIDRLRGKPIAVLFATNMVQALDAAILRRACAKYHFDRPGAQQRALLFQRLFMNMKLDEETISQLVMLTKPRSLPGFGPQLHRYTYSDLAQRLLPQAVESSVYQNQALTAASLFNACQTALPTPEVSSLTPGGQRRGSSFRKRPADPRGEKFRRAFIPDMEQLP